MGVSIRTNLDPKSATCLPRHKKAHTNVLTRSRKKNSHYIYASIIPFLDVSLSLLQPSSLFVSFLRLLLHKTEPVKACIAIDLVMLLTLVGIFLASSGNVHSAEGEDVERIAILV